MISAAELSRDLRMIDSGDRASADAYVNRIYERVLDSRND